MNSYQTLKAEEVRFVLLGLQDRLAKCPRGKDDPVLALKCLEARLAEIAQDYLDDEPALRDPAFGLDAQNRLGVILSSLALLEDEYLPALAHQTDEERKLRRTLMSCASRLGLHWIKDLVVHASGTLAIFPAFLDSLAIPVIHVDANFLDKCLCLPGAFHEFGHSVFLKFPAFLDAMKREVAEHFHSMRKGIGPVLEEEKRRIIERLDDAENYWTDRRLAELFCDLFGQYVAGCANIISMIDLSMAERQPACDTDIEGYPPDAARVKVCEFAMVPAQASSEVVSALLKEWTRYANLPQGGQLYREACPERLLRRFTLVVLELLPKELPATPCNSRLLPDFSTATAPFESLTFEEATQRSIAVLVQRPEVFDSWWRDARERLN